MRVVDTAVLQRLAEAGLTVHDGVVPVSDADARVVTVELPYCVFLSGVGDDDQPRLSGRNGRRAVYFQVTYVGASRVQAKWVGERSRAALVTHRLVVPDARSWPTVLDESQRIRRDDDAVQPDGAPLFYGVDTYSAAITI